MMIYVFLANGFEEVEAITPIDFLRRCAGLEVLTVGVSGKTVVGAHGIPFTCDRMTDEIDPEAPEAIVLPGGMPGTRNLERDETVQKCLAHCMRENRLVGAICAAPSILGHAGFLAGRRAVCYPGFESALTGATVLEQSVCVDKNIITARGAGVANHFAFALVEAMLGKDSAEKLKAELQWA